MAAGFEELRRAYEGVEEAGSFPSRAVLDDYRAMLLERSAGQAAAIAERVPEPGPVLEVGSGNGRLLIALARRGLLPALGVELSGSRVAFARAWAAELGLDELNFEEGDALAIPVAAGEYAAALCVTGAFGYFGPAVADGDRRLLERMRDALRPGGLLCLELYTKDSTRRRVEALGGPLREWIELPEPDPWRFYLSEYVLDPNGPTLTHAKTFVARAGSEIDSGRVERLRLYDPGAIGALLAGVGGFADVELLAGWTGAPYDGGDELIVFARRVAR